jgi:hypothetical protein
LEQYILTLNRSAHTLKDSVEAITPGNKEGKYTAQLEELQQQVAAATERIEAIKPILIGIKEEIANRQK